MSQDASAAPSRSELDIMKAQVRAVEAWIQAERSWQRTAEATSLSREMRLDLSRRREARRREHRALVARADEQLRLSGDRTLGRSAPRAVVAHRNVWLRDKVAARLAEQGIQIVGVFEDGADAAGTIVAEQPDLVLVEDRLPTMTGLEVVRRAWAFAPETVVGAQVLDDAGAAAMLELGVGAVFTRRIPPREIADALLACLAGNPDTLVLA